jgi:hypothetical protein
MEIIIMATSKTLYATLLGGILLASGLPNVYAHSVDFRDAYHNGLDITLKRHSEHNWHREEKRKGPVIALVRHSEHEKHGNSCPVEQPKTLPMFSLDTDYEQVEFFRGSYATITPFSILAAGKYEFSLTDLGFPNVLKDLGAAVTTSGNKLGQLLGTGSMIFDAQPGKYYLSLFANTFEARDLGLFGLNLHALSGTGVPTPSAVPVPGALWLFGSGLLGLAGMLRRKS